MQSYFHNVKFKDGIPTIPEGVRHTLLGKGFKDEQIKVALDTISQEMVKKALNSMTKKQICPATV